MKFGRVVVLVCIGAVFFLGSCSPGGPSDPCAEVTCPTGQICKEGVCEIQCSAGLSKCNSECIDLQNTLEHCGVCDNKCQKDQACKEGACKALCPDGQTHCDGICVNLSESGEHCGACNKSCKKDESCVKGACTTTCPSNLTQCEKQCVDLDKNSSHCGSCGNACKSEEACKAGACVPTCSNSQTLCDTTCVDTQTSTQHCGACSKSCEATESCNKGKCVKVCPTGKENCQGSCVDLKSNIQHCGACNNACANKESCTQGNCVQSCTGTLTLCKSDCVDLNQDAKHCGSCDKACKTGESCKAGKCAVYCSTGLTNCSGKCVQLDQSTQHCGACGKSCNTGEVCLKGVCTKQCSSGQQLCGSLCVSLQTDPKHCGSCNKACSSGQTCDSGNCKPTCSTGLNLCGSACVDLQKDNSHCGVCNKACSSGQSCMSGSCKLTCSTGLTVCGSTCVDLQKDNSHCGTCNTACPSGQTCLSGSCKPICSTGLSLCGSACVDLQTNNSHCGSCNTSCPSGKSCSSGACKTVCQTGLTLCGATCEDLKTSTSHCGACNTACKSQEVCNAGVCKCSSTTEICGNKKDDNCNGLIDEGCSKWQYAFVSDKQSVPEDIFVDSKDNVYVTGWFQGTAKFGTYSLKAISGIGLFLVKIDSQGKVVWAVTNSAGFGFGFAVTVDGNGNSYVHGGFRNSFKWGSYTASNRNGINPFVAKVDASGKVVQFSSGTQPQSSSSYEGRSIALDSKGNIYIAGGFNKQIKLGNTTLTSKGSWDFFSAKLNPQGQFQWAKSFGSSQSETQSSLVIDSKDNIYMGGPFQGTLTIGRTSLRSKGDKDFYLFQMKNTGSVSWAKSFGGVKSDTIAHIAIDSKDNIYATGYFNTSLQLGTTTLKASGVSPFVAKFNASGVPQWGLIQSQGTNASGCAIDARNGTVHVAGLFSKKGAFGGTTLTSPSTNGVYVARYDASTKQQKSVQAHGGPKADQYIALKADSQGNSYILSRFSQTTVFNGTTLTGSASNNVAVAKILN